MDYRIQIHPVNAAADPLPMGGTNPQGIEIGVNQRYLTLNRRPWLPVMGEFHFSRCPRDRWEDELRKIKAGGITILATYLFWIHHEETEGQFDWSDQRDLRAFIQLCGEVGLLAYPRIGPWAHGECRNGGFPDWLLEKCGSAVRQDAPLYLSYVRQYYAEISHQLRGLLWKDGGPVMGIQIENELLDNAPHLATLKHMARELGLDVPIYTMTGWGPADVPEGQALIPVFGGYPDAFWDRQVETWSRASRKHYFFSYLRDDNTIGADLSQRAGLGDLSYMNQYPFGTCETGGGMQVAYHRRPVISVDDVAALAWVKIGNGSNLQGYYMYHGGANPTGQRSTLQESQASGYPNDLPVINYDFQAPLGQYGQVRESYHALRPLHLFLEDFGDQLAPMPMTLPEQTPTNLDDQDTLRWAVRSDGERGFLFINQYQRIEALKDHPGVQFQVQLANETLVLPEAPVQIPAGMYTIWPINLALNGMRLRYATAQPVCTVDHRNCPHFVFFCPDGWQSEFAFTADSVRQISGPGIQHLANGQITITNLEPGPDCQLSLTGRDGRRAEILLLNQSQARQLYRAQVWGSQRLLLCADSLLVSCDQLRLQTCRPRAAEIAIFPAPDRPVMVNGQQGQGTADGLFTRYHIEIPALEIQVDARRVKAAAPARKVPFGPAGVAQAPSDEDFEGAEIWQVNLPQQAFTGVDELLLCLDYAGDAARAYIGRQLVDDDFYHGQPWEIGLKRFAPGIFEDGLALKILPVRRDAPVYFSDEAHAEIGAAEETLKVKDITIRARREMILSA